MVNEEKTFKDLTVWQKAHALVLSICKETETFPRSEQFGIVAQNRRSAVSIPTNIAEGGKRKSRKDYAHFVNIAESSLEETKYHLILSRDLGYLTEQAHERLSVMADEIGRMLYGLRKKLALNS
jgi:four helix bundle protein